VNVEQVVREVTVRGKVQGMDQVANAYKNVSDEADRTATVTDKATRAQISAEAAVEKLRLRYQDHYRQQQQYTDAQATYQRAVDQGRISQSQAAAELANIQTKLGQTTGVTKATATAAQAFNLQIAAMAGGLGITGQVLSAFGPWGFAAAAGLGAVQAGLSFVSDRAHELAQKAKEVKEFSEATGLTTAQFQALRSEAGKFGIDSETMASGISKFTAGFAELRLGQGDLLTQVRRVNPALADQMQRTTDAATAFTLFGKAVSETDNIFQRNALLKAGMGKGSSVFGAFFESKPDVAGLTAAFTAAGKGIDDNLIKKIAQLQIDIDKTRGAANTIFSSAFGSATLEAEKQFANILLDAAKTFKLIVDYSKDIKFPEAPDWVKVAATGAKYAFNPTTAVVDFGKAAINAGGRKFDNDDVKAANSNFQSPANLYSTFQAASAPKTIEALANDAKNLTSVLGAAATPAQRLDAQLKALGVTAREAGYSLDSAEVAAGRLVLRQDSAAAMIGARVGALGAAATVTDLLTQKTLALEAANRNGANLTPAEIDNQIRLVREQANGVGAINAQIDALKVQAATQGMSAGAAAEYSAVQTRLNEGIRNGNPLNATQEAALRSVAAAFGAKTQAAAQDAMQARANFDLQTLFLSDTERQIAQIQLRLHGSDWKNYTDDALSNTIRLTAGIKEMKDVGLDFSKSFVQGLLQGKSGMQALTAAAEQLASKMADKALDSLLSGDFVKAGLQAVVAVGAYLFAKDQKAEEELKKGKIAWEQAAPAFHKFMTEMGGGVSGNLAQTIQQAAATWADLEDKAWKARDVAAINAGRAALAKFSDNQKLLFQATFAATVQGLNDGLGLDSPFMKAVNNVKTALTAQLAFIDDTDVAIGENIPGTMAKARAASQSYLLSLLQQAPALSAVQTGMMQIHGSANALQGALVQLGMSSADAAVAISNGVSKAIASLKTQFEAGLTERLNTANGQSFLNDATKLIQQHQQDLLDATSLGTDPALVAQVFHAEAQKIVDDAGLVGDAFADFMKQVPSLAGVVVQATDDMSASAKKLQDGLNASAKSILDYVNGLYAGSNSTQSPQLRLAAAQTTFDAKYGLAQTGDPTALGSITQDFENLRLAAQANFASGAQYQQILSNGIAKLLSLPAVQQTTDPALQAMRDMLTAINIGNDALHAANDNTTNLVLPAVNAGNATNVANALKAYFDQIDPTGKLSSMVTNTLNAANNTASTVTNTGATATNTRDTKASIDSSNSFLTAINTFTDRIIQALNSQGSMQSGNFSQLILNSAILLNWMPKLVTTGKENAGGDGGGTSNPVPYTPHEMGGWITGGAPGRDSVLLGSRTDIGMPGEFVVRQSIANANRSWLPGFNTTGRLPLPSVHSANDNGDLLAEVRRLIDRVASLEQALEQGLEGHARAGREDAKEIVKAVSGSGKVVAAASRDAGRNPRSAANK
jgi:hypothetical protein